MAVRELLGPGRWLDVRARAKSYLEQPAVWSVVEALAHKVLERSGVLTRDQVDDVLHIACLGANLPEVQVLT